MRKTISFVVFFTLMCTWRAYAGEATTSPGIVGDYKGTIEAGCTDENGNFNVMYSNDFYWVTPIDDDTGLPLDYDVQMEHSGGPDGSGLWWEPDPGEDPFGD